jgi:hypothetical protein
VDGDVPAKAVTLDHVVGFVVGAIRMWFHLRIGNKE